MCIEFTQDVFDVAAHRAHADTEKRGDFAGGVTVRKLVDDFTLAQGEYGVLRFTGQGFQGTIRARMGDFPAQVDQRGLAVVEQNGRGQGKRPALAA